MAGAGIDSKLRLSLREGSIYYFEDRHITSPKPHYFIVVNSAPLTQQVLLLSVVTSKVADVKLRRKACPETLVELGPGIFDVLTEPSIVDCNDLKQIPLAEFNARFVRKEIHYFDKDLPAALRKALRKAIHASAIVSAEVKALVARP
ncbi:MAG: hypothetical protein NTV49_06100 [Kiritimatiellaeota bacterium]|nr:hypothetical protein [Kiritimatiellota bacterium]